MSRSRSRQLGEHVVELARRVRGLAREDVVVERARIERREHLGERAAPDARQQDQLPEAVLGDLAAVLARQLDVGVGVEVRQAEGGLAHRDRFRIAGAGGGTPRQQCPSQHDCRSRAAAKRDDTS